MNSRAFLFLLFLGLPAFAGKAADTFPNPIRDLRSTPKFSSFLADDGSKLTYSVIGGESGNSKPLVFVQGKGESAYRYVELAREMQQKGYGPIYILDHRGQGFSEKAVKDAVHVENFHTYVDDFIKFMDGPVKLDLLRRGIARKPDLVAHSMGGTISNLALRRRPDLAGRVAYIAPMFALELSSHLAAWQNKPLKFLSGSLRALGLGELKFGPGVNSPQRALLTSDLRRLNTAYELERSVGARVPKATVTWVDESLKMEKFISAADKPTHPSIIFRGEYERLVSNRAMLDYACSAENCTLMELPGGHALHQERDPVRYKLASTIDDFFQGRPITPPGPGCERWFKLLKP